MNNAIREKEQKQTMLWKRILRELSEENTLITIESSNMNNEHGGLL